MELMLLAVVHTQVPAILSLLGRRGATPHLVLYQV